MSCVRETSHLFNKFKAVLFTREKSCVAPSSSRWHIPACMHLRITATLEPLCPIWAWHHFCFYVNQWKASLTHGGILAFKWILEFFNCAIVVDKCCLVKLVLFDKTKTKKQKRGTLFILVLAVATHFQEVRFLPCTMEYVYNIAWSVWRKSHDRFLIDCKVVSRLLRAFVLRSSPR